MEFQGNVSYYKKKNIIWFFLRGPHKSALGKNKLICRLRRECLFILAKSYVKIFKNLLYKMIRVSKGKPWIGYYQDVVDQINARPLKKLSGKMNFFAKCFFLIQIFTF